MQKKECALMWKRMQTYLKRSMYAYAQQEWNITERIKVVAGLRTDYFTFDVEDLIPTDSVHTNYTVLLISQEFIRN